MERFKSILFEQDDGIGYLIFNNPEKRNAFTEETKLEVLSALDFIENSNTVRVLVLTGRGSAFCAGGDIKKISQRLDPDEIAEIMGNSQKILRKLVNLPIPVIASVNGDAIGIGCNLVLAADFSIASEKAKFSEVFIKIGAIPDFGALYFLPRLIGIWRSKELSFLGKAIDAMEAAKIGLIWRVVGKEALEKETANLASQLSKLPTKTISKVKSILNKSFNLTLEDVLRLEIENQISLSKTEDYQEGIRALVEKRKPIFHGK